MTDLEILKMAHIVLRVNNPSKHEVLDLCACEIASLVSQIAPIEDIVLEGLND